MVVTPMFFIKIIFQRTFDTQNGLMQPYQQAGMKAFGQMADGSFMNQDPGYQFRLNEGNKAINAAASARGNARGGATMKALTRYGQDYENHDLCFAGNDVDIFQ